MRRSPLDLTEPGWVIFIAIGILVSMGIATIAVTDTHYASGHDGLRNAIKQTAFVLTSALFALVVLRIGYQEISRHAYLIFVVAVLGLVPLLIAKKTGATFGGLATPIKGAYRWIRLPGFQLQPSELMKVAYLIALAWYLRYRKNYLRFSGLLLPFLISVIPLSLILFEPDLGTVILLLPVLFTMLFMAGAKVRHLLIIAMIGVALVPLAWRELKPYQRLRVTAVLLQSDSLRRAIIADPAPYKEIATKRQAIEWSAGSGYQLVHSKNAIGSGGIFGYGWGNGIYVDYDRLPDRHNDLILAIIGHQWGLCGCLLVLACYLAIVVSGVRIASVTSDPFARLLAVGVVVLIATQVIINIGVTVGLMPITGMTLPFVSYGGSSVMSNFLAVALLISVSQRRPFLLADKPFEYRARRELPPPSPGPEDGRSSVSGPQPRSGASLM